MNLYNAILKAADHIGAHPELFQYMETAVPACGMPGCAVGWIAHFLGHERTENGVTGDVCDRVMSCSYAEFVTRMDALNIDGWRFNNETCARALRGYAERHHSHEQFPPTSAMVADLMARVTRGPDIPDEVEA